MMKATLPSLTQRVAIILSCLLWIGGMACSLTESMNPYLDSVAKLFPKKIGNFQRPFEPGDVNTAGLKPEMRKELRSAAAVTYLRVGGPLQRNVSTSAYNFFTSPRAREVLQFVKQGYVEQGYKISEEGTRKRGWFTVGETIVMTRGPETYVFWRNGSVMFDAKSPSANQEDVAEFEKNFPY